MFVYLLEIYLQETSFRRHTQCFSIPVQRTKKQKDLSWSTQSKDQEQQHPRRSQWIFQLKKKKRKRENLCFLFLSVFRLWMNWRKPTVIGNSIYCPCSFLSLFLPFITIIIIGMYSFYRLLGFIRMRPHKYERCDEHLLPTLPTAVFYLAPLISPLHPTKRSHFYFHVIIFHIPI